MIINVEITRDQKLRIPSKHRFEAGGGVRGAAGPMADVDQWADKCDNADYWESIWSMADCSDVDLIHGIWSIQLSLDCAEWS